MNETKNVDKICPIFGSHMIPVISKVPGVFGQQILGGEFKLINCQKDKCQLWANGPQACCIELISSHLDSLHIFAATIEECLNNIEAAIRDLKEAKDENS